MSSYLLDIPLVSVFAVAAHRRAHGAPVDPLGTRLIQMNYPIVDPLAIQAGDGSLRFLVAAHLNEGTAARYPGVAIGHDFNTQHRPERLECRS